MKRIQILFLICELIMVGSAYMQCNTICNDDHISPPATAGSSTIRGKAGPKGERGETGSKGERGEDAESCDCSSLEYVREEMTALRKELAKLKAKPSNCLDIKQTYPMFASGVYTIFPSFEATNGIQVYCDLETDGGGWIMFQSRQDGSVDFFRDWDAYVQGFGQLSGEFWLGLEFVHKLTRKGTFDLRIDLTDFDQNSVYAEYSSFSISEGSDYELDFEEYTGTAGQGLAKQKFTTKDRDQDTYGSNCATSFNGAWWYSNCHNSNLNGLYLSGTTERYATSVTWAPWKGQYYSLKTTQMKFRPTGL